MKSDIEIAREAKLLPITKVAESLGIEEDDLELYGKYKAKLSEAYLKKISKNKRGKLILVTAINPTPAGEGKTTVTIGLGEAFKKLKLNAVIALREPSLGPCFGIKGGAAGGGMAQVLPMDELNLHFTGDFHAITTANNLCCALLDNHIQQGNILGIDTRRIAIKRCLDLNDRVLRNVVVGLGPKSDGFTREDHFTITVASEVMAVFCLSKDLKDLKERLSRMIVAYDHDGNEITAGDIGAVGAMAALLKDAIKPNIIQTIEHSPAIVHGGPFANIAHGCNSVRATDTALKLADYCITEAGFGADLGAEKFLDIKCVSSGFKPDAAVLVATVRALKYNGGAKPYELSLPDLNALKKGIVNLEKHMENLKKYSIPVVVALNSFKDDTEEEVNYIRDFVLERGCSFETAVVYEKGGEGGVKLAKTLLSVLDKNKGNFTPLYSSDLPIREKIERVAHEIYGAKEVYFSREAEKSMELLEGSYDKLPVCIAKTQYSLSDDPTKLGRPEGFTLNVRDVYVSAGAGFIVVLTGNILTMPGLTKHPAAYDINVDDEGNITGLF